LFYGDKYVEENGKTRLATEKEIQSGEAKTANFIEIYLPPIFKDILGNFIDETGKIDPELLKMVGFRIPIQEISSSENIRIKGFLPLEYGNMVIVPSSITGKAGSDFDIDKLTMYLFHYFIKNGRPTKINYLDNTNSTPEERYVHWVKENSNRDTQKYVKFLTKDQVQNIKTNFEIEIAKIKAKYQAISVGKKEELFQEMSEDIKSNINKEGSPPNQEAALGLSSRQVFTEYKQNKLNSNNGKIETSSSKIDQLRDLRIENLKKARVFLLHLYTKMHIKNYF
jgi:hypothetical protein